MPSFDAACTHIRTEQTRFNALLLSAEDVRPEWYLRRYGGLEWVALYQRVCKELKLQPLGKVSG